MVTSHEADAEFELRTWKEERGSAIRASARGILQLRTTDPERLRGLLAKNCVKRGARWLNRNAPSPGWWRNCLSKGLSRIRFHSDKDGVLALAYEYEAEMANEFGYVTDGMVIQKLGTKLSHKDLHRFGFSGPFIGWVPFPKHYPDLVVDPEVLERAWGDYVENPADDMLSNYQHRGTYNDRLFEDLGKRLFTRISTMRISSLFKQ